MTRLSHWPKVQLLGVLNWGSEQHSSSIITCQPVSFSAGCGMTDRIERRWRRTHRVDDARKYASGTALGRGRGVVPSVFDGSETGGNGDQIPTYILVSAAEMRLEPCEECRVGASQAFRSRSASRDRRSAYAVELPSISKSALSGGQRVLQSARLLTRPELRHRSVWSERFRQRIGPTKCQPEEVNIRAGRHGTTQ